MKKVCEEDYIRAIDNLIMGQCNNDVSFEEAAMKKGSPQSRLTLTDFLHVAVGDLSRCGISYDWSYGDSGQKWLNLNFLGRRVCLELAASSLGACRPESRYYELVYPMNLGVVSDSFGDDDLVSQFSCYFEVPQADTVGDYLCVNLPREPHYRFWERGGRMVMSRAEALTYVRVLRARLGLMGIDWTPYERHHERVEDMMLWLKNERQKSNCELELSVEELAAAMFGTEWDNCLKVLYIDEHLMDNAAYLRIIGKGCHRNDTNGAISVAYVVDTEHLKDHADCYRVADFIQAGEKVKVDTSRGIDCVRGMEWDADFLTPNRPKNAHFMRLRTPMSMIRLGEHDIIVHDGMSLSYAATYAFISAMDCAFGAEYNPSMVWI